MLVMVVNLTQLCPRTGLGSFTCQQGDGRGLVPEPMEVFDRERQALLERIAPVQFDIRHQIWTQIFNSIEVEVRP
jgi:hypothetical protein